MYAIITNLKRCPYSDNSPEAQARREEERRKKEEAKEAEYIRQQEVLMKRRTGEWRNVCGAINGGVLIAYCVEVVALGFIILPLT